MEGSGRTLNTGEGRQGGGRRRATSAGDWWLVSQAGGRGRGIKGGAILSPLWLGCGFAHDLRCLLALGCPPRGRGQGGVRPRASSPAPEAMD